MQRSILALQQIEIEKEVTVSNIFVMAKHPPYHDSSKFDMYKLPDEPATA